jgi:MoaA/NifB/PqqE/SkfB family radical SAM enzyme
MVKIKNREHDFNSKLRQDSVIRRLKEYIQWVRDLEHNPSPIEPPIHSPISINLDLTSACNYSCPFCVDSGLINAGKPFALEDIKKIIDTLSFHGLLSVILIGGGEPTLYPDFEAVVDCIRRRKLQIGIATNGSRLERIEAVADRFKEKDWIRISIDAASEETFQALHRPRTPHTLHQILEKAKKVKEKNPHVSLGYSYVIVWEGVDIHGEKLCPNIQEMPRAVELAREFSFDYVSFKPCLIRMDESHRETLLQDVDESKESKIVKGIEVQLQKARDLAGDKVKILESSNLKAMLNQETEQIKRQPKRCHMQYYRTVVSPFGIYHCPAFRGVGIAKIAEKDGYLTDKKFEESLKSVAGSILAFDAEQECKEVGCFYNETNWWLETFIQSKKKVHEIKKVEDDNFFL